MKTYTLSKQNPDKQTLFIPRIANPNLCPVTHFHTYMEWTETLQGLISNLFIVCGGTRPAATDPISRWLCTTLSKGGVNMKKYTAYSIHHTSASIQKCVGVPMEQVLKKGGWDTPACFLRFYHKEFAQLTEPSDDMVELITAAPKMPRFMRKNPQANASIYRAHVAKMRAFWTLREQEAHLGLQSSLTPTVEQQQE